MASIGEPIRVVDIPDPKEIDLPKPSEVPA